MNLRRIVSGSSIVNISKFRTMVGLSHFSCQRHFASSTDSLFDRPIRVFSGLSSCLRDNKFCKNFLRYAHSSHNVAADGSSSSSEVESEVDSAINDFLSRFVWIMRKKLNDAYPNYAKSAIDGMLVIIVEKVVLELEKGGLEQLMGAGNSSHSTDFSEDLWRTVWETSDQVLKDMDKEKKKEKMKTFLQSEEVKEMYRFAGQVGIRGDLLRELRFKWAREKMEESEFYESLEQMREESIEVNSQEKDMEKSSVRANETVGSEVVGSGNEVVRRKSGLASLPKRHGNVKYKIYGLDISDPKWASVANKIHENDEAIWPQGPKLISGKCKMVTSKIMSMLEEEDPVPLLTEWITLLQPTRHDWIALLGELQTCNSGIYFKVSEHALSESSFNAHTHDYTKLVDALAKESRIQDAERILKKMVDTGVLPDVITSTITMQMYCKSGNLDRAKEEFDSLRAKGFQPDLKVYSAMIMAYLSADDPKRGETLMREMQTRDLKVPDEIYMALLNGFARCKDVDGAERIFTTMQFSGIQPSQESCAVMVEAYARTGDPEKARHNFDQMRMHGFKPDDKCISSMISAYQKNNLLDKALNLLLELEKDGFSPGVFTHTTLIDWLTKLELFDEAEQMLDDIAAHGDAPPFKLHISLCDMYCRTGKEKKALQALGVIESKIDQLEPDDFMRIINSLEVAGCMEDAKRMRGVMGARGIKLSDFSTPMGLGIHNMSNRQWWGSAIR